MDIHKLRCYQRQQWTLQRRYQLYINEKNEGRQKSSAKVEQLTLKKTTLHTISSMTSHIKGKKHYKYTHTNIRCGKTQNTGNTNHKQTACHYK